MIELIQNLIQKLNTALEWITDPATVVDAQALLKSANTAYKRLLNAHNIAKQLNQDIATNARVITANEEVTNIQAQTDAFFLRCATLGIPTTKPEQNTTIRQIPDKQSRERAMLEKVGIAISNGFSNIAEIANATGLSFAEVARCLTKAGQILDVFSNELNPSLTNEYKALYEIKRGIDSITIERQILFSSPEDISDSQLIELGFAPESRKYDPTNVTPGEKTGLIREVHLVVPQARGRSTVVAVKTIDYDLIKLKMEMARRIGDLDSNGQGQQATITRNVYSSVEDGYPDVISPNTVSPNTAIDNHLQQQQTATINAVITTTFQEEEDGYDPIDDTSDDEFGGNN